MPADSTSSDSEQEEVVLPTRFAEQVEEVEKMLKDFKQENLWKAGMGGMKQTSLRSLYWKVFLGMVEVPREGMTLEQILGVWEGDIEEARKKFEEIRAKHVVEICEVPDDDEDALAIENPLSDHPEASWSKRYKQVQIEREIEKDLCRMSAENTRLYERPDVKATLLSVLRLFSLENPDTGYRQGMHDVLSGFIYHMYMESHSMDAATEEQKKGVDLETQDLLELMIPTKPGEILADAFTLFSKLMTDPTSNVIEWYKVVSRNQQEEAPIVKLCNRLQEEILPRYNPQLAKHLEANSVQPTTYILRWFRVWFIREFDVPGSAPLWDAVLTEICYRRLHGAHPDAGGYPSPLEAGIFPLIGAAMLNYLGDDLLSKGFSETLRRLMKYPPVEDVRVFVEKAAAWGKSPLARYTPRQEPPPRPKPSKSPSQTPLLPSATTRRAVQADNFPAATGFSNAYYQKRYDEMVKVQREMASALNEICVTFEKKWFEREDTDPEKKLELQQQYELAIAELKRVKDTLSGEIAIDAPQKQPPPPLSLR